MTDVQLFMNIYDIKPNEPLWERIEDKHDPPEDWDKVDLINDIREHGFKYQLNVDPSGNIRNGNARYWVARMLLEEENDQRFLYLPVHRSYAAGEYHETFNVEIERALLQKIAKETPEDRTKRVRQLYDEVLNNITANIFKRYMNTKEPVIPSAIEFEEYAIDSDNEVFLTRHWDRSSGEYTSIFQPHPVQEDNSTDEKLITKYLFMFVLEGHRSFDELLADERIEPHVKDIKNNYKTNKKDWQNRQLLARIKRKKK